MIRALAHATDFSPEGKAAFAHALRLALAKRCRLDLLHVHAMGGVDNFDHFPRIRKTLTRWGVLPMGATVEDITKQTGVTVRKVEISDSDAIEGLSRFLLGHRPDLLVMSTHGRDGLNHWLNGSISAEVAQQTQLPTLLLGPHARPFVDVETGALNLETVLVPVAQDPPPGRALTTLAALTEGFHISKDLIHVGANAPHVRGWRDVSPRVRELDGPVVDAILAEAEALQANLIAMPTAGQQGFLDALRGSTTERVVSKAPCPVLALPA